MKVVYDADGLRIESETEFEQTYIRTLHARGPLTGYLVNGRFLAILPNVPAPTPAVTEEGSEDTDSIGGCPVCGKTVHDGEHTTVGGEVVHDNCADAYREAVKP